MDSNFITILFFLFIAYIVLSSLLKKRPEEGNRNGRSGRPSAGDEDYSASDYIENASDNDQIQKEIAALFKNRINPDNTSASPFDTDEAGTVSVKEEVSGGQKVYMYYDKSEASGSPAANNLNDKIAAEAKEFENVLLAITKKENKYLTDLRMRIKNTKNLKDYIVISEIIGKPKALRR